MRMTLAASAAAIAVSALVPVLGPVGAMEVTPTRPPIVARTESATEWVGFAVSPQGRVFRSDYTGVEANVRAQAKNDCEETTLRTCKAIAVTTSADIAVITCGQGGRVASFLGGSKLGYARDIAIDKAAQSNFRAENCRTVANY
jgi:hypothetical protein